MYNNRYIMCIFDAVCNTFKHINYSKSICCTAQQSPKKVQLRLEYKNKDSVGAIEHFPTVLRQIMMVNEQEHYR